jgi:hypothetical protein
VVAGHLHPEGRFTGFAAGLLHEAGWVVLAARAPGLAAAAQAAARARGSTCAAAWAELHPQDAGAPAAAAAELARAWGLPTAAAALAPGVSGPLAARLRLARALIALRRMRASWDGADPPLIAEDLRADARGAVGLAELFASLSELTARARRLLPFVRAAG